MRTLFSKNKLCRAWHINCTICMKVLYFIYAFTIRTCIFKRHDLAILCIYMLFFSNINECETNLIRLIKIRVLFRCVRNVNYKWIELACWIIIHVSISCLSFFFTFNLKLYAITCASVQFYVARKRHPLIWCLFN